jgi:hypothetical protein
VACVVYSVTAKLFCHPLVMSASRWEREGEGKLQATG